MSNKEKFVEEIQAGYNCSGDYLLLGAGMLDGEAVPGTLIKAPIRMLNRHGLIAGATGTGKTKTLQGLAEGLSDKGVSVLLMDVKGDLSGLTQAGSPHPKIDERQQKIGAAWNATAYPVEFLTLSEEKGARLRATVSEFGPVLFSKILDLNDTQEGVVALIFKYCDDKGLPLLDIKDFRAVCQYIADEGKEEVEKKYGLVSTASIGTIMRKLLEIEQQGADVFFGETSFEVDDLMGLDSKGRGQINILRLVDIQSKPKLFSTFMLCLLAEIYAKFPERGDKASPELIIFIDEAHLIFSEASKALLDQIETITKLIRSKGVGIIFCTQNPGDVPDSVLGQLGLKIQHSLRAFTAKDRKEIKLVAENYPISEFYNVEDLLTQMGIGEAFVSVLNEKGIPTPLAHTLMCAPQSRMDVISDSEMESVLAKSKLIAKYNNAIDRESAFEMLNKKLEAAAAQEEAAKESKAAKSTRRNSAAEKSTFEKVLKSPVTNTIAREVTRGLLGVLGIKTTRSSSKKKGFFF